VAIGRRAVEGLGVNPMFWRGKRVFVTGHTGFKGGWLCLALADFGAEVHGYALAPSTDPSFFQCIDLARSLASNTIADLRDAAALRSALESAKPEIVFHLAAQPLVRQSYVDPVETYSINVMGTVNLFEAVRASETVRSVVNITTDKCYDNREWEWGYRENEPLGGRDPYSSSKACAEMVTAAYRASFFAQGGVAAATARAGNVIGGGDWAADRLLPDIFKAVDAGMTLQVRSPDAIRPWQHVLEPLSGYLDLAQRLFEDGASCAEAWNFGPREEDARSVAWILEYLAPRLSTLKWQRDSGPHPHEAHYLRLDSSKARVGLGWAQRWSLANALDRSLEWYIAWKAGQDMRQFSLSQLRAYRETAA
jgi:CDP-glucose 4,6-dehydratase